MAVSRAPADTAAARPVAGPARGADAAATAVVPPHLLRAAWAGAAGAALVLAAGIVLAVGGRSLGVVVVCAGMIGLVAAMSRLDHLRTLCEVADVAMATLAVPLPVLPATSAQPHRDVAWLPGGVPAVVALPDGGWGLVPHDTAEAAVGRVGFGGRWHTVAEPLPVHDADDLLLELDRVPREGAAVLVADGTGVPAGVTGASIRALAESRRRARTGRPTPASGR